jgi:DNA topoisomerase-1
MAAGEPLQKRSIAATQHFTEPPPRYSEASLVKRMEELGIGRPSTYASILQVLKDRGYVRLEKKRLMPEDKGRVLTVFLENFFARYVEYDFTASLEEQLDQISNNEIDWKEVLRDFWRDFIAAIGETKELSITQVIDALDEVLAPHLFPPNKDGSDSRKCPMCATGRIGLKLGRFGGFIGCSNYPECKFTRQLSAGPDGNGGTRKLGEDPDTGLEVSVRSGRFGSYLQLGEPTKDADGKAVKPKRSSLPKGVSPDDIELERALRLLSLPRDVGKHPDDGEMIVAGIGRFGPYVKHGKTYANIETGDDVTTIGLNRAVTLIEEKKLKPSKGRRFGADPGRPLGDHPQKGGAIVVKNGRYGPYVSHGGVNATLPRDVAPETVSIDQAVALLDARAERSGGRTSSSRRKRPARTEAPSKPAPARKAADTPKKRAAASRSKPARKSKSEAAE